jgi:hypothetical protein
MMWDLVTSGLGALDAAPVIGFALKSYLAKHKLPHGVHYPPGLTPLPLLGYAIAVDARAPWVTYKKS